MSFDPSQLSADHKILFDKACKLEIERVTHDYELQVKNYDFADADVQKTMQYQKDILEIVDKIVTESNLDHDSIYEYLEEYGENARLNLIVDDVTNDITDDMIMDNGMTGAEFKEFMREQMLK